MRLNLPLAAVATAALSVFGCASDDTQTATTPTTDFDSAEYTLTAQKGVVDECLGGAADIVVIPVGDTREFTNPLSFPGSADATYTTKLRLVAPFAETDITFTATAAESSWEWTPKSTNKDVDLGALNATWAGCKADFEFGGTWKAETTADGKIRFDGETSFIVTKMTGDACPVNDSKPVTTPCAIKVPMIASRK